jgi:hypothetical protein
MVREADPIKTLEEYKAFLSLIAGQGRSLAQWAADTDLANQAENNTLDNFRLVFNPKFINTIVTRMDANEAIFKRILDDGEFQAELADFYLRKIYSRLRRGA